MISWLIRSTTALSANPPVRAVALIAYYLAIVLGLFAVYGRGAFNPPPFVYQAF